MNFTDNSANELKFETDWEFSFRGPFMTTSSAIAGVGERGFGLLGSVGFEGVATICASVRAVNELGSSGPSNRACAPAP